MKPVMKANGIVIKPNETLKDFSTMDLEDEIYCRSVNRKLINREKDVQDAIDRMNALKTAAVLSVIDDNW